MNLKEHLEFSSTVAKHIDRRKFFGWFGLGLPFAFAMSFIFQWHEDLVGPVQPIHLLLRGGILFVGFGVVLVIVYRKAVRPALKKAYEEIEQANPINNGDSSPTFDD